MISVVTITYNNFEELKETLESLPKSDQIQSVVINGGDCPKTLEYLKDYRGVVHNGPDTGIANAFNKGLEKSTGDIVFFLNSGDKYIGGDYYQTGLAHLNNNSADDFVHGKISYDDAIAGTRVISPNNSNYALHQPLLHPTLGIRKKVLDQLNGFDESFKIAMDYDLVLRLLSNGHQGTFIDSIVVEMDGSGASSNEIDSFKECYRSLKKNNMLSPKHLLGLTNRYLRILGKKLLMGFGLQKQVAQIKKNQDLRN